MPSPEEFEATAPPPILRPGLFLLTGATAKPTLSIDVKEQGRVGASLTLLVQMYEPTKLA